MKGKERKPKKHILTISSRFQSEKQNRRVQKRANSIQIIENKRSKKTRKKMSENDKKIISISLKDNYIQNEKDSLGLKKRNKENAFQISQKNLKGSLYSKYFIESGHFYKGFNDRKAYKMHSHLLNFPEKRKPNEAYLRENISLKKDPNARIHHLTNNYENIFTSKKKMILYKQKKKIFENLRLSHAQKETHFPKRIKNSDHKYSLDKSKEMDLRPYSAPIDGELLQRGFNLKKRN